MSDLYTDSLIAAKKLRELAESDAKKKIIEQIAPTIKQMITKEVASGSSFFFEEDDVPEEEPAAIPPVTGDPAAGGTGLDALVNAAPPEAAMPPAVAPDLGVGGDMGMGAPVTAIGSEVGSDIMDIGLPDKDGMYVVDINKLWTATPGEDPTAMMAGAVDPMASSALGPVDQMPVEPGVPAADLGAGALPPPDAAAAGMPPVDMTTPAAAAPAPAVPGAAALPAPAIPAVPAEEEEEVPSPAPVVEAVTYDEYKTHMYEVAMKIDEAFFAKKMPFVISEGLKQKLFGLMGELDSLVDRGEITAKQGKLNENRLEFLFMKLKEAKLATSYSQKDKDPHMKSLKEFAAKLFENEDQESLAQDSASTGKTGVAVRPDATAAAQKVDGVQADLFEDSTQTITEPSGEGVLAGGKALPGGKEPTEKEWEEGEPVKEGAEGFGDTSEKPVASPEELFEVDEKELMEAIKELRLEMASKKNKKAIKEEAPATLKTPKVKSGDQGSEKPEGGKNGAQDVLDPKLKEQAMGLGEDTLSLELPDGSLEGMGSDDIDIELMLAGGDDMGGDLGGEEDMGGLDDVGMDDMGGHDMGSDMGGEEETVIDISGGSDEGEGDMGGLALGGDEESMGSGGPDREVLHDEEDDLDEMALMEEARRRRIVAKALLEAKKAGKKPAAKKPEVRKPADKAAAYKQIAEKRVREVATLKKEMAETNLFLSKVLLLNKFLQRGDLSKKQQQAIVEHLDRAKTIAEAKTVYEKIKTKLSESATKNAKAPVKSGSASAPVASASVTPAVDNDKVLTESVLLSEAVDADKIVIGDADRWAVLVKGGRD